MLLLSDLAAALDPSLLMRRTGLAPDPWQERVLRSGAARTLLNCSRQSGKSTVSAALALHEALYRPPALVLLLSPSLRQSVELFRTVMRFYRAIDGAPTPAEESALRVELPNCSRVVSLPGSEGTVRGFAGVRLIVIDEAARVEDDLYRAVRPMLAVSGGRLIAMSTPFGKRGWYFEEWDRGEGWDRVRVPATECPRISPSFLAEERAHLGEWWFRQEYLCEFEESVASVFRHEDIAAMFSPDVKPLFEDSTAPALSPQASILSPDVRPLELSR